MRLAEWIGANDVPRGKRNREPLGWWKDRIARLDACGAPAHMVGWRTRGELLSGAERWPTCRVWIAVALRHPADKLLAIAVDVGQGLPELIADSEDYLRLALPAARTAVVDDAASAVSAETAQERLSDLAEFHRTHSQAVSAPLRCACSALLAAAKCLGDGDTEESRVQSALAVQCFDDLVRGDPHLIGHAARHREYVSLALQQHLPNPVLGDDIRGGRRRKR